jgi:8-oxo-dGTP diphosphatase
MKMLDFGTPIEGLPYRDRLGAYGVALRDGTVLIECAPLGHFLPGGGIEEGETPEEALRREYLEETGFDILSCTKIGIAAEYVGPEDKQRHIRRVGHFYIVELGNRGEATHPDGDDHYVDWIPFTVARERMYMRSQWWAIEQAISNS